MLNKGKSIKRKLSYERIGVTKKGLLQVNIYNLQYHVVTTGRPGQRFQVESTPTLKIVLAQENRHFSVQFRQISDSLAGPAHGPGLETSL